MGNLLTFSRQTQEEISEPQPTPPLKDTDLPIKCQEKTFIDIITPPDTESIPSPNLNPNNSFSLLSYNILAEVYSHFLSSSIDPKYLDISYRSKLIVKYSLIFI